MCVCVWARVWACACMHVLVCAPVSVARVSRATPSRCTHRPGTRTPSHPHMDMYGCTHPRQCPHSPHRRTPTRSPTPAAPRRAPARGPARQRTPASHTRPPPAVPHGASSRQWRRPQRKEPRPQWPSPQQAPLPPPPPPCRNTWTGRRHARRAATAATAATEAAACGGRCGGTVQSRGRRAGSGGVGCMGVGVGGASRGGHLLPPTTPQCTGRAAHGRAQPQPTHATPWNEVVVVVVVSRGSLVQVPWLCVWGVVVGVLPNMCTMVK